MARDGRVYTRREFMDFYGNDWNAAWEKAWMVIADAPQPGAAAGPGVLGTPGQQSPQAQAAPTNAQPAAAAGHGGPFTPAQLSPQAQPAPTIAGAPQPGAAAGPGVAGTPGQQPP